MSRADVNELGDLIDEGEAALLIVGESKLESALDKADLKAEKHVGKELHVSSKDIDKAVEEAAKAVLSARGEIRPGQTPSPSAARPRELGSTRGNDE